MSRLNSGVLIDDDSQLEVRVWVELTAHRGWWYVLRVYDDPPQRPPRPPVEYRLRRPREGPTAASIEAYDHLGTPVPIDDILGPLRVFGRPSSWEQSTPPPPPSTPTVQSTPPPPIPVPPPTDPPAKELSGSAWRRWKTC